MPLKIIHLFLTDFLPELKPLMKNFQPVIEQFTNYPLIAVRNSYLTIQWKVKNALFVYINNGIGFRRAKGIKLTTVNKSGIYKLIAFGFFGRKVKLLYPIILKVNNKVPVPQLIKKEIDTTKTINLGYTGLKKAVRFKQINNINIRYKDLKVTPDIASLQNELKELGNCETNKELEKFKQSHHV